MEHEINILVVEPGRPPRPARVDNSLETFSQLVGGELAMGCFLPQRVMLLYNEDANRQGLPPNRCNPFVNECISGTFLMCGLSDGEGFCSLSPARQAEFQRLFASPGEFMMLGADHICASFAEFSETAGRLWGCFPQNQQLYRQHLLHRLQYSSHIAFCQYYIYYCQYHSVYPNH